MNSTFRRADFTAEDEDEGRDDMLEKSSELLQMGSLRDWNQVHVCASVIDYAVHRELNFCWRVIRLEAPFIMQNGTTKEFSYMFLDVPTR